MDDCLEVEELTQEETAVVLNGVSLALACNDLGVEGLDHDEALEALAAVSQALAILVPSHALVVGEMH